ncbi:MAG: DUF357 domain-containing protein [Candidatus Bathyarchaeia archaeon]
MYRSEYRLAPIYIKGFLSFSELGLKTNIVGDSTIAVLGAMGLEELVTEYVRKTEEVFRKIQTPQVSKVLDEERVGLVVDSARRYLEDARFFREQGRLETALASVAYCEGLLDALRLLGVVEFSWGEGR